MDLIEHLESLSKLHIQDSEKEKFRKDFENIINFVDEIKNIELPKNLKQESGIPLSELRSDEPRESMSREKVLKNAPKQKDGCYVTPMVVE